MTMNLPAFVLLAILGQSVAEADLPQTSPASATSAAATELQGIPGIAPDGPRVVDEASVSVATMHIAAGLRCPVCQGLSVADSGAEAAVAMRHRIEDLVRLGYGDEQIIAFFVDRYGTWVLLEPPMEGRNWLLWVAPFAILALGGGLLLRALQRRAEGSKNAPAVAGVEPSATAPPGPDLDIDDARRVLDELENH
jgi:cytochrome c-type biogenesis protein CcmH